MRTSWQTQSDWWRHCYPHPAHEMPRRDRHGSHWCRTSYIPVANARNCSVLRHPHPIAILTTTPSPRLPGLITITIAIAIAIATQIPIDVDVECAQSAYFDEVGFVNFVGSLSMEILEGSQEIVQSPGSALNLLCDEVDNTLFCGALQWLCSSLGRLGRSFTKAVDNKQTPQYDEQNVQQNANLRTGCLIRRISFFSSSCVTIPIWIAEKWH